MKGPEGLRQFSSGLQTSYKRLWRNHDVTDIRNHCLRNYHSDTKVHIFCCAYNLFVANSERFTNGKPLDINEIFYHYSISSCKLCNLFYNQRESLFFCFRLLQKPNIAVIGQTKKRWLSFPLRQPWSQGLERNHSTHILHLPTPVHLTFILHTPVHTPYSKMAATQDGLGRVARKRGIEENTTLPIAHFGKEW